MVKINIFLKVIFYISVCQSSHAMQCRDIFNNSKVSTYESLLKKALEEGHDPFDLQRLEREQTPFLRDSILDEISLRLGVEEVIKFKDLGGGTTPSYKVTFQSGLQAVFKPVNLDRPNQPIREAVAYRLSRLLKLDIVPPTVVRKLDGPAVPSELREVSGSVQLFIIAAKSLDKGKKSKEEKILLRDGKQFNIEDSLSGRRLRVFDWLINNHDRGSNAGNYLVSDIDSYIIGIDHSVSFVGHDKKARSDKIPFYTNLFLEDLSFYLKLKSASKGDIAKSLEGLNPQRILEFFERYDQLMNDFEKVLGPVKK